MSDPFVEWMQSRLASHGYPTGIIDGYNGPVTTKALKAFQASRGLPTSGVGDAATVAALRQTSGGTVKRPEPKVPAIQPAPPASGDLWPRQKDVPKFFGVPGENLKAFEIPYVMKLSWDEDQPLRKMTLHEKVGPSMQKAMEEVARTYNEKERTELGLDLFGGSYNYRVMRGGSALSMHAYGIAIDFDPVRNGLKVKAPKARLSHADAVPFFEAWERQGFWLSLGRARDFDWMHVQAARL